MTEEIGNLIIIITIAVGIITIVAFLIYYIKVEAPKEQEKERIRRQKVLEEYEKEPEYVFAQARVLSKRRSDYYKTELRIPQLPALVNEFYITFETEDNKTTEFPVRQEIYEDITEGQEGTLVTVNGNFFDFGDGEEIEENNI